MFHAATRCEHEYYRFNENCNGNEDYSKIMRHAT